MNKNLSVFQVYTLREFYHQRCITITNQLDTCLILIYKMAFRVHKKKPMRTAHFCNSNGAHTAHKLEIN